MVYLIYRGWLLRWSNWDSLRSNRLRFHHVEIQIPAAESVSQQNLCPQLYPLG
jgi:hypothetical protein